MSREPDGTVVLSDIERTTRRRFELMKVNEVFLLVDRAIMEVDEAADLLRDRMVEDGECYITITVEQKMKPRKD